MYAIYILAIELPPPQFDPSYDVIAQLTFISTIFYKLPLCSESNTKYVRLFACCMQSKYFACIPLG